MALDDNYSYIKHNSQFEGEQDLEWHKQRFAEYEKNNVYEANGYKKFIEEHPEVRDTHVDIGSGAGWLLVKTAPLFRRVIGIEPSTAGVEYSKFFNKEFGNVEHINADMIAGYSSLHFEKPILVTTSTVLSHIADPVVSSFLKLLNDAPRGSLFLFGEPYGKNRQQFTWHIRSKEWWAKQLPDWQLSFGEITGNGYMNNISGVCVGKENVKDSYRMKCFERIAWTLSGIPSRIKYLGRFIISKF